MINMRSLLAGFKSLPLNALLNGIVFNLALEVCIYFKDMRLGFFGSTVEQNSCLWES